MRKANTLEKYRRNYKKDKGKYLKCYYVLIFQEALSQIGLNVNFEDQDEINEHVLFV